MKTILPFMLHRFGLWPKAIVLIVGLTSSAFAVSPYLDGWYTPQWGAVVGNYIEGTWVAFDDDCDLATMSVEVYSPSGTLANWASGVYDPYYSGYSLGVNAWEAGMWTVIGRAADAEGNYVEGWHGIWVDNPPPPEP